LKCDRTHWRPGLDPPRTPFESLQRSPDPLARFRKKGGEKKKGKKGKGNWDGRGRKSNGGKGLYSIVLKIP